MVRYSKEQKEQTRIEILRYAARMFRLHGFNGVSVDTIMQEAGLTRGAFYYHFKSKAHLFTEVLRWDHDFVDRLQARPGDSLQEEGIQVAMDYLEPAHRHLVGPGCVLTTLAPDVVREGGEAKEAFEQIIEDMIAEFSRGLDNPEKDDPRALAAIALCVGGLLLSRGTDNSELADRISRACQAAVQEQLTRPKTAT